MEVVAVHSKSNNLRRACVADNKVADKEKNGTIARLTNSLGYDDVSMAVVVSHTVVTSKR